MFLEAQSKEMLLEEPIHLRARIDMCLWKLAVPVSYIIMSYVRSAIFLSETVPFRAQKCYTMFPRTCLA